MNVKPSFSLAWRMWLATACTAMALTACGDAGSPASSDEPSRLAAPRPSSATQKAAPTQDVDLHTPFSAYMLTTTERATVDYARSVLINACSSEFGFSYPVRPFAERVAAEAAADATMLSRMYGPTDRDSVKKWGYLLGQAENSEAAALEKEIASQPDFVKVLTGETPEGPSIEEEAPANTAVPDGGCISQADRTLLGSGHDEGAPLDYARGLWAGTSTGGYVLPEYQSVISDWRSCMHSAGFDRVTSPVDDPYVGQLVNSREQPNQPSVAETELALADVDCKEEVDLVARLNDARLSYERGLVDDNLLALQENRARLDLLVRRATEEIEKAGGFQ